MEKERDVGPTTPMGRGTARRTKTSPEQFATPGRGKSCWKVRAYSDGEHFRGTYGPTTFSTPKAETKGATSMTPTTGEGPIHYHIGTPDTRHSPMASSGGMRCDPLLVSRITGLEESVSKLFDVVKGQGRKSEEMLAQMDSMHREFPKLSMTMAAIKAEIQEERTHRTRMVDEVKRAKSHWNQVLEKALHTQEATLKAEERMGKLSENVMGELASTAKSLGGKIENLEHEMGKRDEDRLTAIQTVKSELIEASRRNERRTNHALDELAVKMKEFRKELDERHKEDNATLGKYRPGATVQETRGAPTQARSAESNGRDPGDDESRCGEAVIVREIGAAPCKILHRGDHGDGPVVAAPVGFTVPARSPALMRTGICLDNTGEICAEVLEIGSGATKTT